MRRRGGLSFFLFVCYYFQCCCWVDAGGFVGWCWLMGLGLFNTEYGACRFGVGFGPKDGVGLALLTIRSDKIIARLSSTVG